MWTLDQLEPEIDDIRVRIQQHRRGLKEYFVARDEEIDLAILCACAQEPLLLVGPPGTAKSDLVVKLTESLGLGAGDYFEYMLTKFTEPSEILGPIDIALLKEGRYVRRTSGMLPDCRVAFLDEIFKSNSAILNVSFASAVFAAMLKGICACRLVMPMLCNALCSTVMSLKPTSHLGSRRSALRSRWSNRCTVP